MTYSPTAAAPNSAPMAKRSNTDRIGPTMLVTVVQAPKRSSRFTSEPCGVFGSDSGTAPTQARKRRATIPTRVAMDARMRRSSRLPA